MPKQLGPLLSVVIAPIRLPANSDFCKSHSSFVWNGRRIAVALVSTRRPEFIPDSARDRDRVLVRVKAFSLNYRDQAILLSVAATANASVAGLFVGIGSEFVAEVESVGRNVQGLAAGDRVIPNCDFDGDPPGIPSNRASSRFHVLPASKLIRIPERMDTVTAAGFSIGAQTSYGMVRRLAPPPGSRMLVTAAHSNTSLFVLNALCRHRTQLYTTASSDRRRTILKRIGVKKIFVVPRSSAETGWEKLSAFCASCGAFDAVIDPFFDLHLTHAVPLMRAHGSYVTCGFYGQHKEMKDPRLKGHHGALPEAINRAIISNISILGHCLGSTKDLATAIEDHCAGKLPVVIDSTYTPDCVTEFFQRTFDTADRFGKVVMVYEI
jgi:NADPH:quinone reductase-like Zn-dependent oxidoreductase